MQFGEFIDRVQERTGLSSRDDVEAVIKAVLETLGERLDRKVRNGVEAQLPNELKESLLVRAQAIGQYNVEEFFNRVGARADLTYQDATERTRQVLSILREAISDGEIQDIRESLPGEYDILLGT
jgi:uncharacterized protein (DUF2267 family)